MRVFSAEEIGRRLPWASLIETIEAELQRARVVSPERSNLAIDLGDGRTANLLLMPAWIPGGSIGVKLVTFFPDNGAANLPTVHAAYTLFGGADGRVEAVLEGDALTLRRTAACSALASRLLSRPEASRLLVVGTGALAPFLAEAHASVRDLSRIGVWGRTPERAEAVAEGLRALGHAAEAVADLQWAVRDADIVTTATSATTPVILGEWVKPGTHVDLVGAFKPDMRESDDRLVERASIFVDTRAGARLSGDLAQPLASGTIAESHIRAELGELVRGEKPGRTSEGETTLFKSAGFSLLDLATARLVAGVAGVG